MMYLLQEACRATHTQKCVDMETIFEEPDLSTIVPSLTTLQSWRLNRVVSLKVWAHECNTDLFHIKQKLKEKRPTENNQLQYTHSVALQRALFYKML